MDSFRVLQVIASQVSLLTEVNDVTGFQDAEMLGYVGLAGFQQVLNIPDALFTLQQRVDDHETGRMRKSLEQKGYKVQIRPRKDPKLGQLYVVQLAPVDNVSKASTLVEQVRREDKVQPFVVKVGPEE